MRVPKPSETNRLLDYEWLKARWIREHPNSTPEEYERAMQEIAKRLGV